MSTPAEVQKVRLHVQQLKDEAATAKSRQQQAEISERAANEELDKAQKELAALQGLYGQEASKAKTQESRIMELERQLSETRAMLERNEEDHEKKIAEKLDLISKFTQKFDQLTQQRRQLAERIKAGQGPDANMADTVQISETQSVRTPLGPGDHPEPDSSDRSASSAMAEGSSLSKSSSLRRSPSDAKKMIDFDAEGGGMAPSPNDLGDLLVNANVSMDQLKDSLLHMNYQNNVLASMIKESFESHKPEDFKALFEPEKLETDTPDAPNSVYLAWHASGGAFMDFVASLFPEIKADVDIPEEAVEGDVDMVHAFDADIDAAADKSEASKHYLMTFMTEAAPRVSP